MTYFEIDSRRHLNNCKITNLLKTGSKQYWSSKQTEIQHYRENDHIAEANIPCLRLVSTTLRPMYSGAASAVQSYLLLTSRRNSETKVQQAQRVHITLEHSFREKSDIFFFQ